MGRSEMQPLLGTVDENGFVWTVPRQIFVKLYVATGDADAAARDAKLPKDDPENTTEFLLAQESIKQAIGALHEQVLRRVHETEDTILARYSNWAEGDITDYILMREHGGVPGAVDLNSTYPKDLRKMPRHMTQRVKKFKVTQTQHGTNFEIELHDQMRANAELARLLGLDNADNNEDAKDLADQIFEFGKELAELDDHYDDPDADG